MEKTVGSKSWSAKAKTIKKEVYALSLAAKDSRVPWYAKVFAVFIMGYVLSPIDLIPDFIQVIGYLDDFILVPAAIILLIKMIPKEVMEECREKARSHHGRTKGKHWVAASIIVLVWLISIYITIRMASYLFLRWKGP